MIFHVIENKNITLIQEEIRQGIKYASNDLKNIDLEKIHPSVYAINTSILKTYTPYFNEFLKELNLFDRWQLTLLAAARLLVNLPIHTDSYTDVEDFAINLPLNDCRDTYLVWYKSTENYNSNSIGYSSNSRTLHYTPYISSTMKEISKMERSNMAFVSVSVPHRAVSNNFKKSSCIISMRFTPELTETEIENLVKKIGPEGPIT